MIQTAMAGGLPRDSAGVADCSARAGFQGLRVLASRLAVALGLATAPVAPAFAQIVPTQQAAPRAGDDDDAPLRAVAGLPGLGGFPGRGLSLTASMLGRYESNLGRRQPADDGYRLRPQLEGAYGLGLGRQGLYIEGSVARDIFLNTDRLGDRDRYAVGAGLAYQLSRCTGQAGASWRRSLQFLTDALDFGGFQQERTGFGLTASCRLGGALSVQGSVIRQLVETERGAGGALDFNSWAYSAGLGFGNAGLGNFSLTGSITDSEMPGRLVITPTGFQEDGLKQRSVRLGYQRAIGSRINVALGVSYINSAPILEETLVIVDDVIQIVPREGFEGLGYDVAVDLMISPRLSIDLTAGRNTFVNPVVGSQFTLADTYAAAVRYRLNDRYGVALGISRRNNSFRGGFVSDVQPFVRISDKIDRIFGQFSANLGRRIHLTLDVTHNRRRSNPAIANFTSTGAGLNLSYNFGRGR